MAKWSIDIRKWAQKTGVDIEDVIKESAIYVFSRVIIMSPVDSGRFRANWITALGQPAYETNNAILDPSGTFAISLATEICGRFKAADKVIYMTNSLPYAVRLEYGWSKQAPAGMIRVVARDFQNTVERIVRRKK